MKRILKTILFVLAIVLCVSMGSLLSCNGTKNDIFKVSELAQCQLQISGTAVEDEGVKEEVLRFCKKVEAYQQRTPSETDPKLGETRNTENNFSFRRKISDDSYFVCTLFFLEAEKQLALDYAHRDMPLISATVSTVKEWYDALYGITQTYTESREVWYCKVPVEDYAEMLNLIRDYVD